jgi:hypothetical protein
MNRKTYTLFAILLLAGLLIACGPPATMAPEVEKGAAPPGVDTDMAEAPRDAQSSEGYATADLPTGQMIERMVIRTAQLSLIVEDVELTLPQVQDLVKRMEGYIVQSSSYRTYSDRLAATVTLRVPAERFEEALAALHALAYKVQSETISGEDVTDQYVNLEARLRAHEAAETELLALLAEVRQSEGNAEEKAQAILSIYNQLTNVRTQIEQIQGQMNYLSQMAAMATITVELQPREPEITQPVVEEGYDPGRTISRAARSLVQVLQGLLNAVIWFVIVLLPILLIVAVPVVVVVWLVRRGRRSKGQGASDKGQGAGGK